MPPSSLCRPWIGTTDPTARLRTLSLKATSWVPSTSTAPRSVRMPAHPPGVSLPCSLHPGLSPLALQGQIRTVKELDYEISHGRYTLIVTATDQCPIVSRRLTSTATVGSCWWGCNTAAYSGSRSSSLHEQFHISFPEVTSFPSCCQPVPSWGLQTRAVGARDTCGLISPIVWTCKDAKRNSKNCFLVALYHL